MMVKDFLSAIKRNHSSLGHHDMHGYRGKRKLVLSVATLAVVVVLVVAFVIGGSLKERAFTGLVVQQDQELEHKRIASWAALRRKGPDPTHRRW